MNKPDWEVTATTVYCDTVDDEVTLIVYADGTSRCTGRQQYTKPDKDTSRSTRKNSRQHGKQSECSENDCPTLNKYRDSLLKSQ